MKTKLPQTTERALKDRTAAWGSPGGYLATDIDPRTAPSLGFPLARLEDGVNQMPPKRIALEHRLPGNVSPTTMVDLLRKREAAQGDKLAFRFVRSHAGGEVRLTYRELQTRALAIASKLQTLMEPGGRALLLYPPGLEFIEAFFGCLYAGVVAVPVAPPGRNRVTSSVTAIVAASNPAVVLSTAEHCDQASDAYPHVTSLLERPWLATDRVPSEQATAWREVPVENHQTAFLQFTSGSTSSPKGVMVSHANLLYNAALIQRAFGSTPQSSAVFWLPLYHDMGLIGGVLQPMYCGGSCTLLAAAAFLQRPALWLQTIARTRATISGGPDFAYDLCARKVTPEEREGLDLSSWELAFTGAERIRAQTLERFTQVFQPCGFRREAFFPCFGLAEATLMVSGGPRGVAPTVLCVDGEALTRHRVREAQPDGRTARSLVSCGEGLFGQRLLIVHPETRRLCAADEVGEIWVQGSSVAGGYYARPEATAAVFEGRLADTGEGPFLRTGDLGFLRGGQLFVTGRLKDLILIRGRNYYPEDIEHSVEGAHVGLRAGYCAAFAADVDDRERLVIVQEVEPRQRDLDADAALQAVRRAVAARHEVELFAILLVKAGSIPKTSSGKTRRSACRERYLDGQLQIVARWQSGGDEPEDESWDGQVSSAPRQVSVSEIESWLTQRIASRLRLSSDQVRATTPFLDFGMGSLDAVEIAADLERWLGRRLSPTAIYNHPNIAALARWLAQGPADVRTPAASPPSSDVSAPAADPARLLDEVRQMSESELTAFIQQELARSDGR